MDKNLPISVPPKSAITSLIGGAERVRHFAEASVSDNTRRAYRSDWCAFELWCVEQGLNPLPAAPETVAAFLTAQADEGFKTSTIGRRMATISNAHELACHPSPLRDRRVSRVWKGICREKGRAVAKKKALGLKDLRALSLSCRDDLQGRRDKALLLLGFAAALRRSELVSLDVEDVVVEEDTGIRLTIKRSKTDQSGEGREVGIPCGKHYETCPVLAVRAYLTVSGIGEGALFRPLNRWGTLRPSRLTPQSVAKIVKKHLETLGLDAACYGGHSLRSGFVTCAARAGVPEHVIARQTGHKSVAVLRGYVQSATIFEDNPLTSMDL